MGIELSKCLNDNIYVDLKCGATWNVYTCGAFKCACLGHPCCSYCNNEKANSGKFGPATATPRPGGTEDETGEKAIDPNNEGNHTEENVDFILNVEGESTGARISPLPRGPISLEHANYIEQGSYFRDSSVESLFSGENCALPTPCMNLVLMVMGTFGDVEPFVALGKRLRHYGHRVRVASHACYREKILREEGLEFYPLAGDPKQLSAWAVKLEGLLLPTTYEKAALVPGEHIYTNKILL